MSEKASRWRQPLDRFFDDLDEAVDVFRKGIGDSGIDEGNDCRLMFSQCLDELSHRRKSAEQDKRGRVEQDKGVKSRLTPYAEDIDALECNDP